MAPEPTLLKNPDMLTLAGQQLVHAARAQIEAHGLPAHTKGGYTANGPDWTCEDCSGLYVWLGPDSNPLLDNEEKCNTQRDWTFRLATGRCVMDTPGDCNTGNYGAPVGDIQDACVLPPPLVREQCKDPKQEGVTTATEAAFLWRERYVLSKTLGKAWACWMQECGVRNCKTAVVEATLPLTEGNCHIVEYTLTLRM